MMKSRINLGSIVENNEDEFNTLNFERKLSQLKDSQDSINQLSAWCLQNRQYHKKIVASWLNVLKKVRIEQRLVLFYLANDVIQFSKRKNYEFVESWSTALQKATTFVRDDKVKPKILRIFKIWETRCVYSDEFISDLTGLISTSPNRKKDDQDLVDFQSSYLISKIKNCVQLETDTDAKLKKLKEYLPKIADFGTICATLKDRKNVVNVEKEVDSGISYMESYVEALKIEIKTRAHLCNVLEQAETSYTREQREVNVVANAYKNFGVRVKHLRKKLSELIPNLGSPIPSPDINAPSPSPDSEFELPEYSYNNNCNNSSSQDLSTLSTTNNSFDFQNPNLPFNNNNNTLPETMTAATAAIENFSNPPPPPSQSTPVSSILQSIANPHNLLGSIPSITSAPFFDTQLSKNSASEVNYAQMQNIPTGNAFVFDQNVINQLAASVFNFNANSSVNNQERARVDNRNLIKLTSSPTEKIKNLIEESTNTIFQRIKSKTNSKQHLNVNNGRIETSPKLNTSSVDEKTKNQRRKRYRQSNSPESGNSLESKSRRSLKTVERRHSDRSFDRFDDRSRDRSLNDRSHDRSRDRKLSQERASSLSYSRSRSRSKSRTPPPPQITNDRKNWDRYKYNSRDYRDRNRSLLKR